MKRSLVIMMMGLALLAVAGRAEDKMVPYLGVTTAPVDEALGVQLKLPAGVGLVVEFVDDDGPAAKVLKKNDVLHKLGDQLLVNHEQLKALVQTHKPGDTVTLTVIRAGETKKCDVRLGERAEEVMVGSIMVGSAMAGVPNEIAKAIQIVIGSAGSNIASVLPQISVMVSSNITAMTGVQCAPQVSVTVSTNVTTSSRSTSTTSDTAQVCVKSNEHGTFTLNCTDGKKTFTAVGKDGNKLFDGPVNTDDERDKLTDELKKELAELEKTAKTVVPKAKAKSDVK